MSVMINDDRLARVWTQIMSEMARAEIAHPRYPVDDPVRCAAIVAEEAGEALGAALDLTRPGGAVAPMAIAENLRSELIQTAATAIRALISMHALQTRES